MTRQDMIECFGVPESVLADYEVHVRTVHTARYTDADLSLLSQMVTLYEIGFSARQVQEYMTAAGQEAGAVQLTLLNQKRQELLNTLHEQEKQLDKLDFLRYALQKTV